LTSRNKQIVAASAVTTVNIAVAVVINVLTSNWSWLVFLALAALSMTWIGLEIWRAAPRRTGGGSFSAPALPGDHGQWVPRPELSGPIVRSLVAGRARKVGITTGLVGAGGFGKTTLAAQVYEDPEVKAAFDYRQWVTVGQEVAGVALADAINDISERIDGQRPGLTSPDQAGIRLGELLAAQGRSLLVVDDVWTTEQLRPFLNAGRGAALLVTTRIPDVLGDVPPFRVDQMSPDQAYKLVMAGLPGLPEALGLRLLEITERWPLALALTNAALRRSARDGADVAATATNLLRRLQELGPAALDVTVAASRDRTVGATLESSLSVLGHRRDRVVDLALFPEDSDIPADLVVLLWQRIAGMSPDDGRQLCQDLAELSLVTWTDNHTRLRMHDVILAYLRHECGLARLQRLHNELLDAVAATLTPAGETVPWWDLPASADYLWRTLAYHLTAAGRASDLAALTTTPLWVIRKLRRFGPVPVAEDLTTVSTETAKELGGFLDQMGHLLIPGTPEHSVVNALALRLPPSPAFDEMRDAALDELAGQPRLIPMHDLPDLPDPALNRVLSGHDRGIDACFFTPAGDTVVSVAGDGTRLWDTETGQLIRLIEEASTGGSDSVALSPKGDLLAVEGPRPQTVALWDTETWQRRFVFELSDWLSSVCFSADGRMVIGAVDDHTIRIWDVRSGRLLNSIKTSDRVNACAGLVDGMILGLEGEGLKLWDPVTGGRQALSPTDTSLGYNLAISPDQGRAAIPCTDGLIICAPAHAAEPPMTLHHHEDLVVAAFSPDGKVLATGDEVGLVVLWEVDRWLPTGQIEAHRAAIADLAWAPDSSALASASADRSVRLWNVALAKTGNSGGRQLGGVAEGCVAARDGSWVAVQRRESITIYDAGSGRPQTELGYADVSSMASVGDAALSAELISAVMISGPDNWQASRKLSNPANRYINEVISGGSLVGATDFNNLIMLWDIEAWVPPVLLTVDKFGVHPHDTPPTESKSVLARLNRLLLSSRRRRGFSRRRFNRWLSQLDHWLDPLLRWQGVRAGDVSVKIAPDGSWLAIAVDNAVHIVASGTWQTITTLRFEGDDVAVIEAVPNGSRLAINVDDNIQLWDTDTWTKDSEFADDFESGVSVTEQSWSPNGTWLATVADDNTLRIHQLPEARCLAELRLDSDLVDCAWLDNDRLIVVGGQAVYWFHWLPA
jgi:WD40 repeat protein